MSEPGAALVIDKSDAYINFQVERILGRWGVSKSETRTITELTPSAATLFGSPPTSILRLEDTDAVKRTVETLTGVDIATDYPSGLVVTTSVPRNSTKKLEAIFKDQGESYIPPGKGDDPLAVKLLSEISITKEVREALLAYVGEDYDLLLPIVDSISTFPRNTHRRVTIEDIYARFPQPKGAVAPWLIEKPLLKGDMTEVVDLFRRIHQHSHFLVVMTILKNKLQLAYRVSALLRDNPKLSNDQIAEALNLNNSGQIRFARYTVKDYGLETLQEAVLLIARTESKVKGASAAPSVATVEAMLVELCRTLSEGRR